MEIRNQWTGKEQLKEVVENNQNNWLKQTLIRELINPPPGTVVFGRNYCPNKVRIVF